MAGVGRFGVSDCDCQFSDGSFAKQPAGVCSRRHDGHENRASAIETPSCQSGSVEQNALITGANASGKSTYVKSIAVNAILAQTINTVLAEKLTMQPGLVMTAMAVRDDLSEGDSYFVAEIKAIHRLLRAVASNKRVYGFIDEILKGTNTVERLAASASVINWLSHYPVWSWFHARQ